MGLGGHTVGRMQVHVYKQNRTTRGMRTTGEENKEGRERGGEGEKKYEEHTHTKKNVRG